MFGQTGSLLKSTLIWVSDLVPPAPPARGSYLMMPCSWLASICPQGFLWLS